MDWILIKLLESNSWECIYNAVKFWSHHIKPWTPQTTDQNKHKKDSNSANFTDMELNMAERILQHIQPFKLKFFLCVKSLCKFYFILHSWRSAVKDILLIIGFMLQIMLMEGLEFDRVFYWKSETCALLHIISHMQSADVSQRASIFSLFSTSYTKTGPGWNLDLVSKGKKKKQKKQFYTDLFSPLFLIFYVAFFYITLQNVWN